MSCRCQKGKFDRCFNRLDRPVEESRPDRPVEESRPNRPVDPTGAGQPDRFPSLVYWHRFKIFKLALLRFEAGLLLGASKFDKTTGF